MNTLSDGTILDTLDARGWCDTGVRLEEGLVARLQEGLHEACRICREIQVRNGLAAGTDGTAHHIVAMHPAFLEFLGGLPLHAVMLGYFKGNYILNSFGGVVNRRGTRAYVANVHRDVRFHTRGLPLMLNMIVPLDDFTLENGATYFLTGSHREPEKPDDDFFHRHADRLVVRAGSIGLFDSNLWHAAGTNTTDHDRNALTLTFTLPSQKQQLDYPRLLGYDDGERFSDGLRQILGYNARTPSSLEEWYRPPEKRFYQRDQG